MKVRSLFVAISLLFSTLAFADLETDLQRCSRLCSTHCQDAISRARSLIDTAESDCNSNGGGGSGGGSECIMYLVNKGYSPSTAKSACADIDSSNMSCFQYLVDKGYSPSTSSNTCAGASYDQSDCIIGLVGKGYSPSTARSTCM